MSLRGQVTSVVLVALAVGVGLYAYLVDRGSVTDAERTEREENVFPAYRREEVSRVELVQGKETLAFERDVHADADISWRMTAPVGRDGEVNPEAEAVDQLLRAVEFARKLRKVEGDAPGIASPRVRGTIVMGRVTYRFALGDAAPSPAGAAYVRLDGEGTFVVGKELADALLRSVDAYRPKNFVPYLSLDLAKLEVFAGNGAGFEVERVNGLDFALAPAPRVRASRATLDKVWEAFAVMRAEKFLSDPEADAAVAKPVFTITMTPKDSGKPRGELAVGDACPGMPEDVVVVRKAPTRVSACAPRGVLEGLGTPREALVDRRLFSAREDEVAELKLQASPSGVTLELARAAGGWHERAPEDRTLDAQEADMASALARAVVSAEGSDVHVATDAERQAFSARARVTLVMAEGLGTEVVEVGAVDARGSATARRLLDGALLRVPAAVARKLTPRAVSVRGAPLWRPPIESEPVTALAVRCGGVVQELSHDERGWGMIVPAGYSADASAALDLTNFVMRAKAEAWVADADDGSFGLTTSTCHVALTVTEEAGARTVGITFGAEGEGGFYARADGDAAVFVASQRMRETAGRLMIDRAAFNLDPADLASLTITRAGGKVAYVRGGGDALRAPDGGVLDAKIADALAELQADGVVHLGRPAREEGFDHPLLQLTASFRADAGRKDKHLSFGLATEREHEKVFYARLDGVDATFLVAQSRIDPFLERP